MGDGDVEEKDRSQNLGAHFVRACAVEMHVEISQEPSYARIYRENAAPQTEAKLAPQVLCEFAQSK